MVKTRHTADPDDVVEGDFISVQPRRRGRDEVYATEVNGYGSDVIDVPINVSPRSTRLRKVVKYTHESLSEEDDTPPRTRKRYRRHDFDEGNELMMGSRRSLRHKESEGVHHAVVNGAMGSIRRSTRQRKSLYDTFNQHLIDKQLTMMGSDHLDAFHVDHEVGQQQRKRRRMEVDPIPEEQDNTKDLQMVDMYTRVKRERHQVKRDMYGVPIQTGDDEKDSQDSESTEDPSSDESDEESNHQEEGKSYFLRQHKPRTILYTAPLNEPKHPKPKSIFRDSIPPRRRSAHPEASYRSPARQQPRFDKRKRAAFHDNSSTSSSSSSDSDSDDERKFQRRKSKSMAKARNRCLPMNFAPEDVSAGVVRDRLKTGASLADVDPMNIDRSVTFDSVGGLGKHIRALKEMIVFPLLYPEVFEHFKIAPPRGVLFYGPPGTGKTLVARALANESCQGDKKVAFFMRKGADCLSKWVGESERQLRLLFDQAYQMRPSIIFFDEIDGLAPVRSSRQDQIHSSIVSTLLALMDGLDNRGEIVIIGATNRIDSIDPALRRPGRFDREFLFPLPSVEARKQILHIHTKEWTPKLSDGFLGELSEKCHGYCGADLKALCTEAALHALRRRYPQIYATQDKLQLDVASILMSARDFHRAMQNIVPTAQRSVTSPARGLLPSIRPLLLDMLGRTLQVLQRIYPSAITQIGSVDTPAGTGAASTQDSCLDLDLCSDDDEESPDIFEQTTKGKGRKRSGVEHEPAGTFLSFTNCASSCPSTHRPRLLLAGSPGQGQSSHLAPAVLHHLERIPVYTLDLPAMFALHANTPEESCAQLFREAKRTSPSIVYMPHIEKWWEVLGDTMRATFLTLLGDLEPSSPLLLLATCDGQYQCLPQEVQELFDSSAGEVVMMHNPTDSERRVYYEDLLLKQVMRPPPTQKQAARRALEELPKAPAPEPRQLTSTELNRLQKQEQITMRELRMFLRDVLNKLGRDRKFGLFAKPVNMEEVPDYFEIIHDPMDLSTMMTKVDLHKYETVDDFMGDIDLICRNALEYNPDKDPQDRAIRHRACALKDTTQAILTAELDADFEKMCLEIKEARKGRGESPQKSVPSFYFTKPLNTHVMRALEMDPCKHPTSYSHRLRDVDSASHREADDVVEDGIQADVKEAQEKKEVPKIRRVIRMVPVRRSNQMVKNRLKKSPWCRSSKRLMKRVVIYLDEFGNEIPQQAIRNKKQKRLEGGVGEEVHYEDFDGEDEEENHSHQEDNSDADKEPQRQDEEQEQQKTSESNGEVKTPSEVSTDLEVTINTKSDSTADAHHVCGSVDSHEATSHARSPRGSPRAQRLLTPPRTTSPRGAARGAAGQPEEIHQGSPNASPERDPGCIHRRASGGCSKSPNDKPTSPERQHLEEQSQEEHIHTRRQVGKNSVSERDAEMESEAMDCSASTTPPGRSTRAKDKHPSELTDTEHAVIAKSPNASSECQGQKPKKTAQENEDSAQEGGSSTTPPKRVTRWQVNVASQQRALAILQAETPNLVFDQDRLLLLLAQTVEATRGRNIEQLERLYSVFSQCIYHHRKEYDKSQLVLDLQNALDTFTAPR